VPEFKIMFYQLSEWAKFNLQLDT